jgi:hypothetical protein
MATLITLVDDDRHADVPGEARDGRLLVDATALSTLTGWQLKPEGLCRDDVCVPVGDRKALADGERIDVEAFTAALGRVAIVDADRGVAALGPSAATVAEQMQGLMAPDFRLADLDGNLVSLHDLGRRKRLLLAWSSW